MECGLKPEIPTLPLATALTLAAQSLVTAMLVLGAVLVLPKEHKWLR
jgi:hypothetical protein